MPKISTTEVIKVDHLQLAVFPLNVFLTNKTNYYCEHTAYGRLSPLLSIHYRQGKVVVLISS